MKKRKYKSERGIGLDESDPSFLHLEASAAPIPSLRSAVSFINDDFTSHVSYFLLNDAHVALKEQAVKIGDTAWDLLCTLKEKFCSSPGDKLDIYAPTICKTLEIVSFIISDAKTDALERAVCVDHVECIMRKTFMHIKIIYPSRLTSLSGDRCRLIDCEMSEQITVSALKLVHRLFNLVLLRADSLTERNCRLGTLALEALGGTNSAQVYTTINLLGNNDKSMIAFFLERHEVVLRLVLLQTDSLYAALLSKFCAQMTAIGAFILLLHQCVFDEVLWVDLLMSKETRALEYMLRISKALLDSDQAMHLSEACGCAHGILSSAPIDNNESRDKSNPDDLPKVSVWEQCRELGGSVGTKILPIHWRPLRENGNDGAPISTTTIPTSQELFLMTCAFLSRLRVKLMAVSVGGLSFDPGLIVARLERIESNYA